MKERFKSNKWALVLFIVTICVIVSTIVGTILLYVMLPQALDEARKNLVEQGVSNEIIDVSIELVKGMLIVSIIISIIITIFVCLCGFKCSLTGSWRIGAIVFGIILVFFDFISLLKIGEPGVGKTAIISNLLSIALSILYLIGAIKCDDANDFSSKNILTKEEIKIFESNDNEF